MPAGVVTPEAVLLELPTAGVATRTLARLVDLVLQIVVGIALFLLAGAAIATGVSPELMILVVVVASIVVIPVTVEVLSRGRSPGKALFGLRVVDRDGSPSTPRQAVVRGAVAIIDTYLSLGFLALTVATGTRDTQRPGDLAAGTVVIRERAGRGTEVPVAFLPPAGLEALVASLDVSRLDDEDFSLVRAFLLRVDRLDPADRLRLATELAEGVRRRIDQPVSAPVTAEVWLVCVASAYQSRRGNLLADAALGLAPIAAPIAAPIRSR
ncbi:MAG: RDD family protein [Microthrixaceae bacterium]